MDTTRAEAVGDAIVALGYDGLLEFDRNDPAHPAVARLVEAYERGTASLLALCGGALAARHPDPERRFWAALEQCALADGEPEDTVEVADVLERFVVRPVNAGLPDRSRDELVALFGSGFAEWFVEEHLGARGTGVWEHLADTLDAEPRDPVVVRAMEHYDLATMCATGDYLPLPTSMPPPDGEAVVRLTAAAGLLDADADEEAVREAWQAIAGYVGAEYGRQVSVLRLGSIVRRLGEVLLAADPGTEQATLESSLQERVDDEATELAAELTHTC
jgi:N-glycosylase/DNA lyase